jgi:predicted  nucleic acid-binding Zn-ribbon protein
LSRELRRASALQCDSETPRAVPEGQLAAFEDVAHQGADRLFVQTARLVAEGRQPEHVIEAITGHLSRRMLEHYSHQRLKAKGQMLTRMEERRKKESA